VALQDNKDIGTGALLSPLRWRGAALPWVLPAAIILIAVELQRRWGDAAVPVHVVTLTLLTVTWIGMLWERMWIVRFGAVLFDAAILVQLIGGLILIQGFGNPAGSWVLDELLFWAPAICAWWAMCYLGQLRHTIILALVLYLGFFVGGLLDADHALHEFVLQGALMIGLVTMFGRALGSMALGVGAPTFDVAMHDTLTNVASRPYFEAELAHTAAMSDRYQQPFSLLVANIDDYADYCQSFGADEGKRMLRAFAWIIAERIRRSDTICRWQDEKFVVLLPVTRYAEAAKLVDTLRPALSQTQIGAKAAIKTSFGIAEHDPGSEALATLEVAERSMSDAARKVGDRLNGAAAAATSA
jgi:diguanylate cyclase (GGDEF)-like protein